MGIEWVIAIGAGCLLIGGVGGYFLRGRDKASIAKAAQLEAELDNAQQELSEYRGQVYNQFAETAERFKQLDESYHALHRQLATSAVALCGDEATPLLTAASTPVTAAATDSTESLEPEVVTDGVVDETAADSVTEVSESGTDEIVVPVDADAAEVIVTQSPAQTASDVTQDPAQHSEVDAEEQEIPVLSEVTNDDLPPREKAER
ncbi:MAG: DUF1043 family protein [Pseudomonadota bacterium]